MISHSEQNQIMDYAFYQTLDSKDELAEENGEDLIDADCQKLSDDDEDDLAENEEAEGFIVEDDYLSVSELNYSEVSKQDEQHIQEEL